MGNKRTPLPAFENFNESKTPANVQKYLDAYNRFNEIEELYRDRDKRIEMAKWERDDLKKEYKKVAKKMNTLSKKISQEDFEQHLEGILMHDYVDFQDEWGGDLESVI